MFVIHFLACNKNYDNPINNLVEIQLEQHPTHEDITFCNYLEYVLFGVVIAFSLIAYCLKYCLNSRNHVSNEYFWCLHEQFKTAYCPRGRSFNLRDFHYAVHHLPSDSYLPLLPEDSGSFLLRGPSSRSVFLAALPRTVTFPQKHSSFLLYFCFVQMWNFQASSAMKCFTVPAVKKSRRK